MELIYQISTGIIQILQSIGDFISFLDTLIKILTYFGDTVFYVACVSIIYWCISEKIGKSLAGALLTSAYTNTFLKGIFGLARPYQILPNVYNVQETTAIRHITTANGFSFPSGHAQSSGAFWSALSMLSWRTKIKWLFSIVLMSSVFMIPFIAFTRVYLAVHWPLDVVFGAIIGVIIGIGYISLEGRLTSSLSTWSFQKQIIGVIILVTILLLASSGVTLVTAYIRGAYLPLIDPQVAAPQDIITYMGFSLITASCGNYVGVIGGLLIGIVLDKRFVNFKTGSGFFRKITRVILGLSTVLMIYLITKIIMDIITDMVSVTMISAILKISLDFIGFFLIGFVAVFVFPLIFTWIEPYLFEKLPQRIRGARTLETEEI